MSNDALAPVSQDKPEDYFRSLLAARGMPVFAGGSPEADEGGEETSETTEAPETGQAEETQESFTDFDPEQVPEEARPYVEGLQKEWQSNYSKKRAAETQEIAQERQEAQEYREFLTAIQNDPAARDAWLQQEFGYEFDDGEPEEFLDPEDELRARLEAVEGNLTQQQQAFVQEQQTAEAMDQIAEGIESLEKTWGDGFEFKGKTLKAVQAYAEVHGPQAIPEIGEAMRELAEENRENWIKSKKSGRRISQGAPARKAIDPTNQEERFKLYDEIAEEAAPSME